MILIFLSRCLSRCVLNFDSGDRLSFSWVALPFIDYLYFYAFVGTQHKTQLVLA
jgi:hypothetical protein